jgi:hypothetical protein
LCCPDTCGVELVEKLYKDENWTATIKCPNCRFSKAFELSQYRTFSKAVRLRISCRCGYTKSVLLERRENFRKQTDLSGSILTHCPDENKFLYAIKIKDLSVNGICFKIIDKPFLIFEPGDTLLVRFKLNERHQDQIEKEAVIRNYNEPFFGAEFTKSEGDNQLCYKIFLFE